MIELPPTVPVFQTQDAQEAYQCSIKASRYYNVSPYVIHTILQTEGGVRGSMPSNTNATHDIGPMQINNIWIDELKRIQGVDIDRNRLLNDVCYNIYIGTWILAYRIMEANGDVWKGVGNYHSKTPSKHAIYMRKIRKSYRDIVSHWQRVLSR